MNNGLSFFKFPDNEVGVSFNKTDDFIDLYHPINSSNDAMNLFMAIDAIQSTGTIISKIIIPCLPYQRQDRRCKIGESFSLQVFFKLLNSVNFTLLCISRTKVGNE